MHHLIFSSACRRVVFIRTTLAPQLARHTATTMSGGRDRDSEKPGTTTTRKAAQKNSKEQHPSYSAKAVK